MAKIGHSKSIQTTLVGKYWKSSKIGHSKSIQTTLVGKYGKVGKQPKLAVQNELGPLWWENMEKLETAKIGHSESIWTTLVGKYR